MFDHVHSERLAMSPEKPHANAVQSVRMGIKGMSCASCVSRIESALQGSPGVSSANVSFASGAAEVTYDPAETNFELLRKAVSETGYEAVDPTPTTDEGVAREQEERDREYRGLMRKFWFAAAVSVPNVILMYPDVIPGLGELIPAESMERRVVWVVLGLLTLPVLLWSGSQFFVGMWAALKHRSANMHTLITVGVSAAFVYSVAATAFPGWFPDEALAEPFWDVATVVIALVVLGSISRSRRWLSATWSSSAPARRSRWMAATGPRPRPGPAGSGNTPSTSAFGTAS